MQRRPARERGDIISGMGGQGGIVSRAFVKEDGPDVPATRHFGLPAREDPGFAAAAARALLAGANIGDTASAEAATGYFWGDPALVGHVRELLAEAEATGDDRLDQLARRYLRQAGVDPEE
jgi:hypothetical protein